MTDFGVTRKVDQNEAGVPRIHRLHTSFGDLEPFLTHASRTRLPMRTEYR